MLKLDSTIKVMIPTKDNDGKAIDYMALVQGVTKLVGGSTMYDAKGLWVSNSQVLYNDSNKLVELNVSNEDAYNTLVRVMKDIVNPLLHEGGQLAVWLQVNGTTFIINRGTVGETLEVAKSLTEGALAIEKYRQ